MLFFSRTIFYCSLPANFNIYAIIFFGYIHLLVIGILRKHICVITLRLSDFYFQSYEYGQTYNELFLIFYCCQYFLESQDVQHYFILVFCTACTMFFPLQSYQYLQLPFIWYFMFYRIETMNINIFKILDFLL